MNILHSLCSSNVHRITYCIGMPWRFDVRSKSQAIEVMQMMLQMNAFDAMQCDMNRE